jgi:hypothetical protein
MHTRCRFRKLFAARTTRTVRRALARRRLAPEALEGRTVLNR